MSSVRLLNLAYPDKSTHNGKYDKYIDQYRGYVSMRVSHADVSLHAVAARSLLLGFKLSQSPIRSNHAGFVDPIATENRKKEIGLLDNYIRFSKPEKAGWVTTHTKRLTGVTHEVKIER